MRQIIVVMGGSFNPPTIAHQRLLLDTGDAILEEGNHWNDTFWGVRLKNGQGQNHLGKILMQVRMELCRK